MSDLVFEECFLKAIKTKERLVNQALKKYIAFCNLIEAQSSSDHQPSTDSVVKAYNDLCVELDEVEYATQKTALIVKSNLSDFQSRKKLLEAKQLQIEQLQKELVQLKVDLELALAEKAKKDEYLKYLKMINMLPSKSTLQENIRKLQEEIDALEEKNGQLQQRYDRYLNHLKVMFYSIEQANVELQSEEVA